MSSTSRRKKLLGSCTNDRQRYACSLHAAVLPSPKRSESTMPEPSLLERAAGRAPTPSFTLDDVEARRTRAQRRRRLTSGAVGGLVTLALIALAVAGLGPFSSNGSLRVAHGG